MRLPRDLASELALCVRQYAECEGPNMVTRRDGSGIRGQRRKLDGETRSVRILGGRAAAIQRALACCYDLAVLVRRIDIHMAKDAPAVGPGLFDSA